MKLLFKLLRLFSGKPNVIQTRSGVARLPVRSWHSHWIVGRDLCMYRREDFANVPRNRRRSALELKLPVWSPFERTGHHCVWSGSSAMVWFWDEAAVGAGRGRRARVLPETVFLARKPDGVHLQGCREGFDLQYWRAGVLTDSFWFPDRPDEHRLGWFVGRQGNGAGGLPSPSVREASDARIEPDPWSSPLSPGEWFEARERPLVAACLLALSLVLIWQEARIWKIHHVKEEAAGELARMQDELDPLLEARNELVRLRRTNRALTDILGTPSQARLMGLVDRAIPGPAAQFQEWRYQQRELKVVVEDPDLDPIAYVRSLEAEPLFEHVRAKPAPGGDNRIEITLRVRG